MLSRMRIHRVLCLFALALSANSLLAQTYTAAHVHFSDLGTFTQQQLEDAAGVHSGTKLTADDLGAAAQRLVDTGYFDAMSATIDGRISAATILFDDQPTPLNHMMHVGFENLIWLSHDELVSAIRTKIPLFNGYLLDNSPHVPEMKAALAAALAAKSIVAEVSCEDFEPTVRHPLREVGCRIVKPSIRVTNIKLGGVTPDLVPFVQKSVTATVRTPYNEGPAEETTVDRILAPLLDAGYIQARLIDATPVPAPVADNSVPVVLTAQLSSGEVFHVSGITFSGNDFLSAESFTSSAKLRAGDIASRRSLLETLMPLDMAYRRKGYMDVIINAVPTIDASAHTVAYNVTVDPGEQYRLHEVTTNNLDAAARAEFTHAFHMKEGDIYNLDYVTKFLVNNEKLPALLPYGASFKSYADPNSHIVDLVINFYRAPNGTSVTVH